MSQDRFEVVMVLMVVLVVATALAFMVLAPSPRYPNMVGGVDIWTDPETGCQYIDSTRSRGGMTPRIDANGKHICTTVEP